MTAWPRSTAGDADHSQSDWFYVSAIRRVLPSLHLPSEVSI